MDNKTLAYEDELIGGPSPSSSITTDMMFLELFSVFSEDKEREEPAQPKRRTITIGKEQGELDLQNDLGISARWANRFSGAGISYVRDLVGKGEEELLSIVGIGRAAVFELDDALRSYHLPSIAELADAELSDRYDSQLMRHRPIPPYDEPITISMFRGLSAETIDLSDHSLNECVIDFLAPKEAFDAIEEYADKMSISSFPSLYDTIPPSERIYNNSDEPLYTYLSHSINYYLYAFGLERTDAFLGELASTINACIDHSNYQVSLLSGIYDEVPKILYPAYASWLFDSEISTSLGRMTIGDLVTRRGGIGSAFILRSIVRHFNPLSDYKTPISIESLFRESIRDYPGMLNGRDTDIFLERIGAGSDAKTLEEIAIEFGITRERVRQIALKANGRIDLSASKRLLPLRLGILGISISLGCIGNLNSIINELIELEAISTTATSPAFLQSLPELLIDPRTNRFQVAEYPCPSCHNVRDAVSELERRNEAINADEFLRIVGCDKCKYHLQPSLTHLPIGSELIATKSLIGPIDSPRLALARRPSSVRARIHAIMASTPHALSYAEIRDKYAEYFDEDVSKARISAHVGSDDSCLLWGRGTYIYADYAPFPKDLIRQIVEHCKVLFIEHRVPILGVGAVYKMFEAELLHENIPTEHALYSLLRCIDSAELELREYPWICDAFSINGRTSFAKYFYSVLDHNNGFITDAHANDIANRCLAQSFALGGLAEYSDYVIHANGGWYDVEAASFDMQGIAKLAREVAAKMHDNDIISAFKVFEDNRERCLSLGVKSYDMLYYLIDMMEDDLPIEATRRPHFVKSQKRGLSVAEAMRIHIRNSCSPVTREELYREFAINRGLKVGGIASRVLANDDIVQIGEDTFWANSKLGIDTNYIAKFEESLDYNFAWCKYHASLFYLLSDAFPNLSELPSPQGLPWNPYLLKTVFLHCASYKVFGNQADCVVDIRLNPDVRDAESFFCALLRNEFYGWSPFSKFTEYCRIYKIESELSPEFFDAFDSINANEVTISVG